MPDSSSADWNFRILRTREELDIIHWTLVRENSTKDYGNGRLFEEIRFNKDVKKTSELIIRNQMINYHIIESYKLFINSLLTY